MTTLTDDMRRYFFLVILLITNVLSAMSQEMYMNVFTITEQQCGDKPMQLELGFLADYQGDTKAVVTLSVNDGKKNVYWEGFPLQHEFTLDKKIPSHLLQYGPLKCYIYNPQRQAIKLDSLNYSFETISLPTYVPDNLEVIDKKSGFEAIASARNEFQLLYSEKKNYLELGDDEGSLTMPISVYLNDNQYFEWKLVQSGATPVILQNENELARTTLEIFYKDEIFYNDTSSNVRFEITSEFLKEFEISRFSMILPFAGNDFTVYRSNLHVDTVACQDEYYLDQEGFSFRKGEKQLNLYHPKSLSSIQLDAKTSTAILNIDYELDHPMIHYPARTDTVEYYENISKRKVKAGDIMTASFDMSYTQRIDLPRFMPVWDGYESAIIFTEHADWTDLRTHRAVCFGNESVTCADSAVGGYVYYGIPLTKSVFYSNPDGIINIGQNREFPNSHCTIKTDPDFFDFLKQLKDKGFEICLHTPEQYTATRDNLYKALAFMKENFGSPTWIDHGYNNSFINNREDLVCDGLNKFSPYYALDAWRKNGVRYLWNAAYEELKPFDDWTFNNNIQRPYPFFGDALPHPRFMRAPFDGNMLMWSTEYTLEPGEFWNYYLSQNMLETVVESRSAYIAHVYSPWVTTARGFWDMENGQIVAKSDMNKALERIANLREQHLMLPTTIEKYLKYQEQLQNIDYQYDKDDHVVLTNNNSDTIHGFTLISKSPIDIEMEFYEPFPDFHQRESSGEYMIWFDFRPKDMIIIHLKETD